MTTLADKLTEPLRKRYRASGVPAFVSWWSSELGALLPQSFCARLMPPKPQLWIVPSETGGDLRVWRADQSARVLDLFGAGEDPEILANRWLELKRQFDDGAPEVLLCLPESMVLSIPVEMPAAVEANLGQALKFQIDQLTPFKPDQVYFDQCVLSTDAERGRLNALLRVAPKAAVDPLLERARGFGATVHTVDTLASTEAPRPEGFNLLPREQRQRYVHARARFNLLLAVVAVAVLGLVMAQTLILRERTVANLEREAEALRVEARRVAELRRQLEESLTAANFLAEKRAAQPTAIEVLREVTALLPNDIWLQQFMIADGGLTVQGQADGSQRVVSLLNESPLLRSPELTGPISIDPRTGQERFRSKAEIVTSAPDAEASGEPGGGR